MLNKVIGWGPNLIGLMALHQDGVGEISLHEHKPRKGHLRTQQEGGRPQARKRDLTRT